MRLALCAITAIVVSNRPRPKASGRSLADERPAGAHPERDVARQGMPDRVEHDAVVEGAGHEAPFPAARPDRREDDRPALAVVGQRDRAGGRERPGALRPLDRLAPPRLVEDVDAVEARAPSSRSPRRRRRRSGRAVRRCAPSRPPRARGSGGRVGVRTPGARPRSGRAGRRASGPARAAASAARTPGTRPARRCGSPSPNYPRVSAYATGAYSRRANQRSTA